jgi:Malectin domain
MKAYARSVSSVGLASAICLGALAQARAAVVVTYGAGPNLCTTASGYLDYPFCTIPGEIPLGSFAVPAIGGTYTDPNFGGVVRVMTGTPYIHPYALPSPISAHNKYLNVLGRDSFISSMLDLTTGAVAFYNVPFAGGAHVWDAQDDDVYYRIYGTQVVKHTLSTNTDAVVADYAGQFTYINAGGSTDTSKDNWLSFWAPNEHNICAIDLINVRTYCADYLASDPNNRVGWDFIDYSLISKGVDSVTGKRYVFLMAAPALGAWSVNLSTGRLDFEYRGPENLDISQGNHDGVCDAGEPCLGAPHADVMEDSDGKQYMVTTKGNEDPCELDLMTFALSSGSLLYNDESAGGGRHRVINLANCGTNWPDYHVGCAKSSPYCVLSIYSDALRSPADLATAIPQDPHRNQIMVMRGNGQEVRVLATSHSILFDDDSYWPQPRAALSNDGAWVVFDSDFGIHNGERVNVMATGFGSGTSSTPDPPVTSPGFSPIRVNAGGSTYTDSNGNVWAADSGFTGGTTILTTNNIQRTSDRTLYQCARLGPSTYSFTVPNGTYRMNLKWSEDTPKSLGQRKFNVVINGATVLANFDILAAAGMPYTAVDKSFPVTVTGGTLTIAFTQGSADVPVISGIEILQQ